MAQDNTQEILAMLRKELESKNTLFLGNVDVIIERIIYSYIFDILKSEGDRRIIWLCLGNPVDRVLYKFKEYGFDMENDMDRLWFIDVESPGKEPSKNTLYCSSRTDYTKMASHISSLMGQYPGAVLVADGISLLASDTLQIVENFLKFIRKTVSESNGSIVSMLGKGVMPGETEGFMRSFFDVIIDVKDTGEVHSEIGLKSLDLRYRLEDGSIYLEQAIKKIKRERLKILVVDDEPDIPELVKLSLSHEPYDFIVANSGMEAVDKSLEEHPDLILLDIMMPDMDGYEVVEHLKQDKDASDIPVIMVSAKTAVEDKVKGMELGIDDYISKPFDKREMNARIKMVMKRFGWPEE